MSDEEWTFGVKPKQIDRLLSLGLDHRGTEQEHTASMGGLIERPGGRVGRQARLAHAEVRLEQRDFASAITELEALAGAPAQQDEAAGQAHAMLANIYYEGDPCAPGQTDDYHQLWKDHRQQAEQLIGDTAAS